MLVFLLLLVDEGVNEGVEEGVEGRKDGGAAILDAGVEDLHVGGGLKSLRLLVAGVAGQVMRKSNALVDGDVQGLRELLDPEVSVGLRFRVVPVEYHDHPLSLLLDAWPGSIVLGVA